jgi:gliding motility-associated-like protein
MVCYFKAKLRMDFFNSKIFVFVTLFLLRCNSFFAQNIELYNHVIGSSGAHYSGNNLELSSTIGETIITTVSTTNHILTQGFHQPLSVVPLAFTYEAKFVSCPQVNDGSIVITSITGCSPPYQVSWGNGQEGLQLNNLPVGIYNVTITGQNCEITTPVEVLNQTIPDCKLVFYSGFTPNGDNDNNNWVIDNIGLKEFENNTVEIFNRWGNIVWQGDNYNNNSVAWKGDDRKGETLPEGTYFYIIEISNSVYKGYIELTR